MSIDSYEFAKSNIVQSVNNVTPFSDKSYNYINDINASTYSFSGGNSLVQFDLSAIYNSTKYVSASDFFFVIPLTLVTANCTGASPAVPISNKVADTGKAGCQWEQAGLKSGYWNLINGVDLVSNGRTLEQYQPYTNVYTQFKMISELDVDSLRAYGVNLGMGKCLDNPESLAYNGPATTVVNLRGGNGLVNNSAFPLAANGVITSAVGCGEYQNQWGPKSITSGAFNYAIQSRLSKFADLTAIQDATTTTPNGLYGATGIESVQAFTNEFRPYTTLTDDGLYIVTVDYAIVRFSDLLDSMKMMPLIKKFDAQVRLYINTGSTIVSNILQNGNLSQMSCSGNNIAFTSTCPILVNQYPNTGLPDNTAQIISGLFVGKPTATSINGVNLGASAPKGNPMTSCRCYYNQITLKPEKQRLYEEANRAKSICYTSILSNQYNGIVAGGSFSQLIQSQVKNIRGVLIVPFMSGSTHGLVAASAGITPFSPLLSPFTNAPNETGPISLINLQVAVGGQNVLSGTQLNYTWENFLEQVTLYRKVNGQDYGISSGLFNQHYWNQLYRPYYVDCSRGTNADNLTPRNVNISFTNNSNVAIDVFVFTEYFDEFVVDVVTGYIKK